MKRLICLFLLLLLPFPALADELTSALDRLFPRYHTTGAVVAVARQGQIVFHYDYGYADKKQHLPVTEETYFKTASVTKLVSALGVMRLVEDGLLALEAPIGSYLGYDVVNPAHADISITLRHLMSHTSGIKGSYSSGRQLSALLASPSRWNTWAPGTRYAYSNLGAGIMGSLMEAVTGQDVNTCLREQVFAPLSIDAGYRVHLLDHPEQAALRYNSDGWLARTADFYLTEPWDPRALPESHYDLTIGDLWIRGDDLCRLGMMLANNGCLDGVRILQTTTVDAMLHTVTGRSPYGLCVERVDTLVDGLLFYGHQGMSDGVLCNLYWEPKTQFVFALITNGCDTRQDNRIALLSRQAFAHAWASYGTSYIPPEPSWLVTDEQ